MKRSEQSMVLVVVLSLILLPSSWVWADNEGQEDLDKAADAKMAARTLADLTRVVELCESALKKGLDEPNTQFANGLLSSSVIQRGRIQAETALRGNKPEAEAAELRKKALSDLERGVELGVKKPEVLFDIARLNFLPGGSPERAKKALDQTIESARDLPALQAKAFSIRAATQKDPKQRLADLDAAIRLAPTNPMVIHSRALLQIALRDYEKALDDFDRVIELAPKYLAAYEVKAALLATLKKYDEALVCLDQALELNPKSIESLSQKARVHVAQDNYDAALLDLEQALSVVPDDAGVLLLRSGIYQEMEQPDKAMADITRVLETKPNFVPAMRIHALLLAAGDKLDEAIVELEKARKLEPEHLPTHMQLGLFYNAAKRYGQAIELYSSLLDEQAENMAALRGRGDALLNSGKQEKAIADYEAAHELAPKDSGVLNNLAWVLATSPDDKLRDGKRALRLAAEACEVTDYKAPHILSTLGAAHAEMGDFEEALRWARKGLEVSEDDEERKALQKEVECYEAGRPWREILHNGEPVSDDSFDSDDEE